MEAKPWLMPATASIEGVANAERRFCLKLDELVSDQHSEAVNLSNAHLDGHSFVEINSSDDAIHVALVHNSPIPNPVERM